MKKVEGRWDEGGEEGSDDRRQRSSEVVVAEMVSKVELQVRRPDRLLKRGKRRCRLFAGKRTMTPVAGSSITRGKMLVRLDGFYFVENEWPLGFEGSYDNYAVVAWDFIVGREWEPNESLAWSLTNADDVNARGHSYPS
uniref:Uncharacterized protein n=1 Tax=Oryza sativa subsp. japonica TaxID=39947 RepID=Q6EQ75_ORYSJ|nr:hypothetical protein [Oryza sativa Japonica Group]BAD29195.1 hypothetical protein [Oryza sativa Japonica Group]